MCSLVKKSNERDAPMHAANDFHWRIETSSALQSDTGLTATRGHGLLRLESFGTDKLTPSDSGTNSRLPVFMVDENPVASGFGAFTLELPEGSHIVSATVFGHGEASVGYPVTIEAGKTADLRYVMPFGFKRDAVPWAGAQHVYVESKRATRLGRLGSPLSTKNPLWSSTSTHAAGLALAGIFCLIIYGGWQWALYGASQQETLPDSFATGIHALTAVIACVAIWLAFRWVRQRRARTAAGKIVGERVRSADFASPEPSEMVSVTALGSKPVGSVVPSNSEAKLLIDLRATERAIAVSGRHGEKLEPWRTPGPPPVVAINGSHLPRGWGQWLLTMKPGTYSVSIDVVDHRGRPSHHTGIPVIADTAVSCELGRIARVRADISISYEWTEGVVDSRSRIELVES